MKLSGAGIERFLAKPDPNVRAVLIFGPDEGMVRERAQRLGQHVVQDLNDPFRVTMITAEALIEEPSLLADEAASLSLMGGRRLIRVRGATDKIARAFSALLDANTGDSLTLIEAGELSTRSALRKAAEASPAAAAIACYVEDQGDLTRVLGQQIAQAGKSITPDALSLLAASLLGDRMMARNELDKLLLYVGDAHEIGVVDVQACIADAAALEIDDAIRAALGGDLETLDRCLVRLAADGTSGVGILRLAQNHVRRLHLTRGRLDAGASLDKALSQLQPPLFFKTRDVFAAEVQAWPLSRLSAALERLVEAEAKSKRTGANDALLTADALFAIGRVAAGQSRRPARYGRT